MVCFYTDQAPFQADLATAHQFYAAWLSFAAHINHLVTTT